LKRLLDQLELLLYDESPLFDRLFEGAGALESQQVPGPLLGIVVLEAPREVVPLTNGFQIVAALGCLGCHGMSDYELPFCIVTRITEGRLDRTGQDLRAALGLVEQNLV